MSCVNYPSYKVIFESDVAAGATQTYHLPLPRGGTVERMSVTSSAAIAASGTAANVMAVTLQDKTGTTLGTITNNTGTASNYNPPILSQAYAAHVPSVLDFEKRPGINYALVKAGDRPTVNTASQFNKAIAFDIPQGTAFAPTLPDETNVARIVIAKGASVPAGQVTVEVWVREG